MNNKSKTLVVISLVVITFFFIVISQNNSIVGMVSSEPVSQGDYLNTGFLTKAYKPVNGYAGEIVHIEIKDERVSLFKYYIELKNDVKGGILVKRYRETPSSLPKLGKKGYQFIQINLRNLRLDDINKVRINFRVNSKWLSENSLDKNQVVVMKLIDGNWVELNTKYLVTEKSDFSQKSYMIYEFETDSLSEFVVTYKDLKEKIVEETPYVPAVEEKIIIEEVAPKKKGFFSWLISFFS